MWRGIFPILLIATLVCTFFLSPPIYASPDSETLRPNAVGTYQAWDLSDSTHYGATNDTNDSTYIYTGVDEERDTQNLQPSTFAESVTINWITVNVRLWSTGSGQPEQAAIMLISGSDWENGPVSLNDARGTWYDYATAQLTQDPTDSQDWTKTKIDALEAGLRLKQIGGGEEVRCAEIWVVVDYSAAAQEENFYGVVGQEFALVEESTWLFSRSHTVQAAFSISSRKDVGFPLSSSLSQVVSLASAKTLSLALSSSIVEAFALTFEKTVTFTLHSAVNALVDVVGVAEFISGQVLNLFSVIAQIFTLGFQKAVSLGRTSNIGLVFTVTFEKSVSFSRVSNVLHVFLVGETRSWVFNTFTTVSVALATALTKSLSFTVSSAVNILLSPIGLAEVIGAQTLNFYSVITQILGVTTQKAVGFSLQSVVNPLMAIKGVAEFITAQTVNFFGSISQVVASSVTRLIGWSIHGTIQLSSTIQSVSDFVTSFLTFFGRIISLLGSHGWTDLPVPVPPDPSIFSIIFSQLYVAVAVASIAMIAGAGAIIFMAVRGNMDMKFAAIILVMIPIVLIAILVILNMSGGRIGL